MKCGWIVRNAGALLVAGALPFIVGCGGSKEFQLVPVKGVVNCGGKPISGGTIVFSPVAVSGTANSGRPAASKVAEDGSFELTTYRTNDGAIVGRHVVTYLVAEEGETPSKVKVPCRDASIEIEIKNAEDQLTVDLSGK